MNKRVVCFLLLFLLLWTGSACAERAITSIEQLNAPGITIGVGQGDIAELVVKNELPQATISYFDDKFMGYIAVAQGKIDAFAYDRRQMELSIENGQKGVHLLEETLNETMKIAVGISPVSKIPDLTGKINRFIAELRADGTLEDMFDRWVVQADETMPDIPQAENPSLHLTVGTSGIVPPYSYYVGKELNGYDIELAYRFAAWLGADVRFKVYDYGAIVPAAMTGDIDCIMANLEYLDERDEELPFSDILFEAKFGLMVRGDASPAEAAVQQEVSALDALNGKRIGVATGTTFDAIVLKALPDAKPVYINSSADLIAALEAGKIDGFAVDEPAAKQFCTENPRLAVVDEYLDSFEFGIVLPKTAKSEALLEEINAWLVPMKESGELERVIEKWADGPEEGKTLPDYAAFPAPKGTLTLATEGDYVPMTYYRGTEVVGAEIDLIAQFCEANGYGLKVQVMNFDGILPAVQTGKVDFAAAGISITDERRESVNFSVPYYSGGTVMVVLKSKLAAARTAEETQGAITGFADLEHARIGVATGSIQVLQAEERFPDAELFYFSTDVDMLNALRANKIDAFASAEALVKAMMKENADLTYLDGWLGDGMKTAAVFPKTESGQALCDQFSAFIREIRQNGVYEEIQEIWFGEDEEKQDVPDLYNLPGTNGTLRMAADTSIVPFVYVKDGKPVGSDIDTVVRFCKEYGYGLEVVPMDFSGIIPSVITGKADFSCSGIAVTAERAESVLFSEPTYETGSVLAVLKNEGAGSAQTSGIVSWQDYNGKRLGVLVGPLMEDAAKEYFPDSEYLLFNSYPDCIAALLAGKIDAYLGDELGLFAVHAEQPEIDYIHDRITQNNYSFAFRKNDPDSAALCGELNDFLKRSRENGTMEDLENIWYGIDEEKKVVDMSGLTGENGTIRVVTTSTDAPFSYIKDGKNVGYDIDLVVRFCRDRGYALELGDVDFAGRIPAIQSGKYDFTTDMNVTPEREEQVLFSDPTGYGGIVLAVLSSDLAAASGKQSAPQPEYTGFSDLSGKMVSMLTGAPFEELVRGKAPDVGEFTSFNSMPDMILALQSGKTDAILSNNAIAALAINRNHDLALFPQELQDGSFGFAFAKGDPRRDVWRAAFAAIPQARIQAAWNKWTGADESVKALPEQDWPGANGSVRVAACDTLEPMSYAGGDGQLRGFDLEIILMIAKELDVRVEFTGMDFAAILASVQAGKADIGAGSIIITPERAQAVDFLEYYPASFVLVVRAQKTSVPQAEYSETFWDGLRSSFHKTFIREGRWRLFADGVLTTLLITVLSILLGTALGFLVFMLCRNGNIVANGVTRFSMWLVQGMPMVVLLMILYYIIFGSVAISGIAVAVIGFTLTFGASVFGLLKMGVGTIDRGQYEAAYALGYANRRTFFRIILPQAIPHILPAYKGEIVGLIKATAIVGYIAVQDLTKMGDIVRSRTYEAFFPLIAVTVIYFVLEGLLGFLVSKIQIRMDPKKRKPESILKGVKTHD